ncbi:hypothetical protein QIT80_gp49 (endogenous virus) [Pseudomonas phage phiAH14a]|uniref:Uncharacterized protein n=1 Tax=Pseudomonas phage phiAH14a TaxID=1805958 RepID=A0A1B0VRI9_9CAUD|nr:MULTISPECIES: hypothetical protein [unclassified Pseudomonas]YP_010773066.1 hypothetical protein QIT80_gp49 [Pseudomonas phage phiAH14a]AMW64509.1 hypothetical protein AH14a_p49 [Pseudomonas phage phiAH14a]
MSAEKLMCWLFGIGFWGMFVLMNVAISQRDDAGEFKTTIGGSELVCRVVKP